MPSIRVYANLPNGIEDAGRIVLVFKTSPALREHMLNTKELYSNLWIINTFSIFFLNSRRPKNGATHTRILVNFCEVF